MEKTALFCFSTVWPKETLFKIIYELCFCHGRDCYLGFNLWNIPGYEALWFWLSHRDTQTWTLKNGGSGKVDVITFILHVYIFMSFKLFENKKWKVKTAVSALPTLRCRLHVRQRCSPRGRSTPCMGLKGPHEQGHYQEPDRACEQLSTGPAVMSWLGLASMLPNPRDSSITGVLLLACKQVLIQTTRLWYYYYYYPVRKWQSRLCSDRWPPPPWARTQASQSAVWPEDGVGLSRHSFPGGQLEVKYFSSVKCVPGMHHF